MTVAQLVAFLQKMPQDLPVTFHTYDHNVSGFVTVDSASIEPADFGQMLTLESNQIPHE